MTPAQIAAAICAAIDERLLDAEGVVITSVGDQQAIVAALAAARDAALEEAERVCRERAALTIEDMPYMEICREMEARACAESIAALRQPAPGDGA